MGSDLVASPTCRFPYFKFELTVIVPCSPGFRICRKGDGHVYEWPEWLDGKPDMSISNILIQFLCCAAQVSPDAINSMTEIMLGAIWKKEFETHSG